MKQNWLTQKAGYSAWPSTFLLTALSLLFTFLDWMSNQNLFKASPDLIFIQHHYLKLWTTLFVHADFSHLLGNLLLFIPLVYLISSYFGGLLLPSIAILFGGFTNWLVLHTLSGGATLIGISGVVDFLGALWLILYFLIDSREKARRRFAHFLFITLVLFVPETYKPEISYLSHLIGYFLGLVIGLIYFYIQRSQFKAAEVYVTVIEDSAEDLQLPKDQLHEA